MKQVLEYLLLVPYQQHFKMIMRQLWMHYELTIHSNNKTVFQRVKNQKAENILVLVGRILNDVHRMLLPKWS